MARHVLQLELPDGRKRGGVSQEDPRRTLWVGDRVTTIEGESWQVVAVQTVTERQGGAPPLPLYVCADATGIRTWHVLVRLPNGVERVVRVFERPDYGDSVESPDLGGDWVYGTNLSAQPGEANGQPYQFSASIEPRNGRG